MTGPAEFTTTRWSLILRARGWNPAEAPAAMEELCRLYWFPLYAYIRRKGHSAEDAADLTQDFFAKLLNSGFPNRIDPEGGRLRSYLLIALNRFLINDWRKLSSAKRGGGHPILSLEALIEERGEGACLADAPEQETAEHHFQRAWAEGLLHRVFQTLEQECRDRGDTRFQILRPFVSTGGSPPTLKEAAEEMGLTLPAFKSLLHRFRQRYREILLAEVAQTVSDPADITDEIRAIIAAIRKK